jgi:hypothetical protein
MALVPAPKARHYHFQITAIMCAPGMRRPAAAERPTVAFCARPPIRRRHVMTASEDQVDRRLSPGSWPELTRRWNGSDPGARPHPQGVRERPAWPPPRQSQIHHRITSHHTHTITNLNGGTLSTERQHAHSAGRAFSGGSRSGNRNIGNIGTPATASAASIHWPDARLRAARRDWRIARQQDHGGRAGHLHCALPSPVGLLCRARVR